MTGISSRLTLTIFPINHRLLHKVQDSCLFPLCLGSHSLPGYYSMRRPIFPDAEFCSSSKQFSTDIYSSALTAKSFSCDTTPMPTYSSLIDSYYPETFSDYRSAAHTGGGSALFSSSALATRLPPFPGDTSHFMLVRRSVRCGFFYCSKL